jgi:hypothetical protein
MQPLSQTTRRLYLILFVSMFAAILPVVILYADGWRWTRTLGLYKTGGVFISVPYPDADVSLDGENIGRSGFFDRSFYVGDLAPAAYVIDVAREGYLPWSRVVVVEPQLVTDAQAVLFPQRIELTRLAFSGVATTGIAVIPRAQYNEYLAAFEATTASTTLPQDESEGTGLFVENGNVFARWMTEEAFPSSQFCSRPSFCVREITIEKSADEARTARFFRGGVVYATRESGIYFVEADIRPTLLNAQLFEGQDTDFRIINDTLIVSSGENLYEISL